MGTPLPAGKRSSYAGTLRIVGRVLHGGAAGLVGASLLWSLRFSLEGGRFVVPSGLDRYLVVAQAGLLLLLILTFPKRVHDAFGRRSGAIARGVFITLMALALFEGALRLFDPLGISDIHAHRVLWRRIMQKDVPPAGKRLRPQSRVAFHGWSVSTNTYGFRDEQIPSPKPARERRILLLGDSYAFGHGVRQDSLAATLLEHKLADATGHPWQVINTGVGSYATHEHRLTCEAFAEDLEVDLVLLLYCYNDCQADFIRLSPIHDIPDYVPESYRPTASTGPTRSPSARVIALLKQVQRTFWPRTFDCATWLIGARKQAPPIDVELDEDNWAWRFSRDNLVGMRRHCRRLGIPFLVAYVNHYPSALPTAFHMKVSAALEGVCRKHGIPFYDLRKPSLELGLPDHPNSRVDGHPDSVGQEILAEILWEVLKTRYGSALERL